MGNEQSAESPRGHRKLSKPPHCSQASAAGLPYTATAVTPHREHFSNSYLVGSLPPAPNKASTTRRVAPGLGIAVPAGNASSPIQSSTCRDPMQDLKSRTRSIQSEQSPILPAFVNSSRTSSIAQDSSYRTLTRADSMPVTVRRGSPSYDTRAAEAKKLLSAKDKLPSEPIISKSNKHSDETSQDVTVDTKNATQSAGSSISRTNSDVSLYMPMRRRSVVQTPGIATRAHHSNPPVSTKSSFRKSLPATPSQSRHNSMESGLGRRMSMPTTIPSQAQSPDRAVTPVEADYKQLGGMKFGSLRITNGAPGTSPMSEDDVKQQGASESALAIPRAEYFHEQAKSPLRLMNQGSAMTEANELMAGEKSLTSRVTSCVTECSSDAEKSRTGDGGMSRNGNAVSFPVAEVLDLRDDPNAKPNPKKMQLGLENKMLKGISRSDSGFIPSPSSEKTNRSASRVDSGYSSNVSLRSLPSLRSGVTDKNTIASEKLDMDVSGMCSPSDSNSTRTSSLVPSQTRNRLPIHLEVPLSSTDDDTSSTCPTSPSSPASRPFSPFSRDSRMRLSSLKSNKSFEPRVSNAATAPIVLSNGDFQEQLPSPTADVSRGGSKIYRFLNGSRRKGSLKKGEVTTIEQDVTTDPLGQKTSSIPKPNRPSLRKEPSKDTLHTIMSVGSQDAIGSTRREEDVARGVKKTIGKKMSRRQSWRQSIAQLFGSRSAEAGPALSSIPEPEPTPRRPSTAMELTSRSFNAAPSPRARPAPRKAASSSSGLALETRKMVNKSNVQESRDKPELAHLRTNVSAPNLSAKHRSSSLSPSSLEMDQMLRTKTSPPVSMQNRGSKPPRAKSQAQNRAMTPSFPINSRPSASRRLSLPQDYGRMTPHSRQISHGRTESRSSSRGMAMSPTAGLSSQQVNAVQHSRVLSYSSNGTQRSGPAAQQAKHHRRVSAPAQPHQIANMPRSRSSNTLLQIQQQQMHQQQMLQQHQQRRPRTSVQSWAPMDMHNLNQQLQQNYMMQNQALVYGAPNMVQQYPNIYVTSPVPNHPVPGRQGSQGGMYVQDPPFRVLHSYNSPAYRNVPIWSQ
ncbi:SNF5-component of SWI SNF transcription activator complex [Fusarium sp. NRRL 52700]|nr:SNF5-component of SWI SNF transcription activator complex [Fusarium sp. NRRL 52700]